LGLEKNIQNKSSWLETLLTLVFANIVLRKRAILLIFEAEFTENMLEILSYPESNI